MPSYQIVKNVENLYVENIDFENFPMIKFENCDNIIFNNCSFTDFENNGIVFRDCSNIAILNSKFTNCGNQISDSSNSGYSIRIVGDAQPTPLVSAFVSFTDGLPKPIFLHTLFSITSAYLPETVGVQ